MYPRPLDQLSPRSLAVIEYFYRLSNPSDRPVELPERAHQGLSHFLMYLAEVTAHEPGALSFLPGRSLEDALARYPGRNVLIRHVVEALAQKVLLDEDHRPDKPHYTTPLPWPQSADAPVYMPRFTLYMELISLLFGGIKEVSESLARSWNLAHVKLEDAIREHFARENKRGQNGS